MRMSLADLFMKKPIGEILVSGSFVSQENLNAALERQKDINKKIGELLVESGAIDEKELLLTLRLQEHLSSPKKALKFASGIRKRLGEILLSAKKITSAQLEEALEIQKTTGEKLGKILVKLGYISERELKVALLLQDTYRKPISHDLRIGNILLSTGIITDKQLNHALKVQKASKDTPIGEILISLGYISKKELEKGLILQKKLLSAFITAFFTLAPMMNLEVLEAIEVKASTIAKVTVAAYVKSYYKLNIVNHQSVINISERDIEKGFIEINAGTTLEIKTNSSAGIALYLEKMSNSFFDKCIVNIGDKDIPLSDSSNLIFLKNIRKSFVTVVDYRFELKKGIRPGQYQFPFLIDLGAY